MPESLLVYFRHPLFLLTLTVAVYYGAFLIYKKTKIALLHPILLSIAVIITFLNITGIEYLDYYEANSIINFMLGLSVVSIGYLLYENINHIKGEEISILISVFIGSLIGVASVVGMSMFFGVGNEIMVSLQPKSVTTPIALALSENSGGIPALTSIAVIVTGIFGSIIGPWIMKLFGIKDPVARGLALGSASHAVGTARAMELGAVEGAVGGAAIGIMGIITALVIPFMEKLMAL